MSQFVTDKIINLCSKFYPIESCSKIVQHSAFLPAIAAISSTSLLFTAYKYNTWKKAVAFQTAQEKELKLAKQRELEIAQKKAQEILQKKEKLIQNCEKLKTIEANNKKILDSLFVSDWSIPLAFPDGAAELGYAPENTDSKIAIQVEPAFDAETSERVSEIRQQIKTSIESKGKISPPNLLLSGVAGVGKTMLIANVCKHTGTGFIKVPTGTIESNISIGNEIETLKKIVAVAETSSVPVYIMLDDGESLFDQSAIFEENESPEKNIQLPWEIEADRFNSNDIISKRRNALIKTMIDLAKKPDRKISFALTTNRPDVVSCEFKETAISIDIQSPKKQERITILIQSLIRIFGKNSNILGYFSKERMSQLGDKTEGFTGRNLVKMVEVLSSSIAENPQSISDAKIDKAIEVIKPSVEALRHHNG
jgi:AAA+ superfamily predicted ATPase